MNPRYVLALFFVPYLFAGWGLAQEASQQLDFTIPPGMVKREFLLGHADIAMVEELVADTQSKEGKHFIFKTSRKLLVIDKPENIEAIRTMLPHISQPAPNVKIEFISRTTNESQIKGGGVSGQVGGGGVIVRRTPGGGTVFDRNVGGSIDIDIINQSTTGSQLNTSFILVRSGSDGYIEVTKDVPMVDYFTRYIANGSYGAVLGVSPRIANNQLLLPLGGGVFQAPEFRWEKVGTRLLVHPTIEGDLIHLEIMPQISSLTIVDRDALRRRELNGYLTGREQYVTFRNLSTTVTVRSGQQVQIGGFADASAEFNRFFFGAVKSQRVETGNMTVRATIQ